MNFTQQDATQVPTCALTSLKIYRIMLVIGIDRNLAKSTGKEMNKSLWKSYISFQEQSNHQIRAVWKSKINGWRLETLKGRDFRYNCIYIYMKNVDFTTLSCTHRNMPNVNTMGNRTQAKNLPFNSSVCSFVYPASNVPSMETSMCVSQPQTGYNIFESIHIWLQKRVQYHALYLPSRQV